MEQYAVVALAGGKLSDDGEVLMYLPDDGTESKDLMEDLKSGSGYGIDYVIVRRDVGPWETVNG